ncbi:TIGR03617 family F420-dependent LLM class oxidoreductase [Streptacidiphilus jiangxiensis]|uniref:Probable F420-dependent oxidoreductase, MSMEG_2256 family n=1 Tax=Streptacidiphilus jiangxiensis TaxID=235985 RepID=A0A1H7WRS4_STRJI|nr:probable F420-dependent oxidoreductase, MSMEG_2256 family [Streptacidiphilus jiangxiensis]
MTPVTPLQIDDAADVSASPFQVEAAAVAAEAAGYDGFSASETRHDVFASLMLAARATERITLRTAIAVAFARNPMTVATLANDLQLVSGGRFELGLGSQVQAHIERRFAMPWSRPAARMEEFVRAVRAIWAAWAGEGRLFFKGDFYRHTLMTEFFDPGPNPHGTPPILLAAVGERMTQVAGRVADGLLCHAFTTPAYLRERTLPALLDARGGSLDGFTVCLPAMAVLGADPVARAAAEQAVRGQIAFYASTPAYRPVLELHGWGDLGERLHLMSRRGAWQEMAAEIPDEVLDAFAVAGGPAEVADALASRFGGAVSSVSLYTPYAVDPALTLEVAGRLRGQG